jgi:polar amino acid transport system substrate-binding protein
MIFVRFLAIHSLLIGLVLTLLSPISQAREDIIFVTALPADNEIFRAGEELLAAISFRMDESIKLISIPGKRSAILLKNNEIHAELARVGEYEQKVPFAIKVSEPIIEFSQYAYSLKSGIAIDGWGSLKGYRSVALRGIWIIEAYMADHQVTWVDSISSAFHFLKSGRADVGILNSLQADKFLAAADFDVSGIKRLEPAIYSSRNYTFFAAAYPQLALRYEVALRAMKADGSYQTILSKFDM